jgi:RNA polymerase sigma factor (sigma-70 family)
VGSSAGVLEPTPTLQHRDVQAPSDHQLVAAVRRGDDRAFEALYSRYHRRIQAYVLGMCKDHARAEDITQEIFVSALRRMRETERPIAFKPWVYEIAKNACIDQHRRARRTEEISLEAEEGFAPADYGRLVTSGPTPDAAVVVKQELDHLCGAFGGLSETHHEILVMRELEGLSYREIGERLGMTRPAVESTLFRARRRLTEEFDELVSGERCMRIQGIIATAGHGALGARDTRRLARHIAHCQPCRREARAAGLDANVFRAPLRTRVARKVAALLPFPLLGRRFTRGADDPAGGLVSGWAMHAPAISDQLGTGWTKAAAAVAVVLAGVGAGVGSNPAGGSHHKPASLPAAASKPVSQPAAAKPSGPSATPVRPAASKPHVRRAEARLTPHRSSSSSRVVKRASGTGSAAGTTPDVAPSQSTPPKSTAPSAPSVPSTPVRGSADTPSLTIPAAQPDPVTTANQVVSGAGETVSSTVGNVQNTVDTVAGATGPVGPAVSETTQSVTQPVQQTVGRVTDTVNDTVTGLTGGLTP